MIVSRLVWRAQLRDGCGAAARAVFDGAAPPEEAVTCSAFRFRRHLFVYCECAGEALPPEALFPGLAPLLEPAPFGDGPRAFVRMSEIFHYNRPTEGHPWRDAPQGAPWARLNRLRPEMVASYVFYHHQLQEERPGAGDKYGLIALSENLLFFYGERPRRVERALWTGALATSNTPADWDALMARHFLPWPDTAQVWRDDIELVFFKECRSIGAF